jgi:hypothetical protein
MNGRVEMFRGAHFGRVGGAVSLLQQSRENDGGGGKIPIPGARVRLTEIAASAFTRRCRSAGFTTCRTGRVFSYGEHPGEQRPNAVKAEYFRPGSQQ